VLEIMFSEPEWQNTTVTVHGCAHFSSVDYRRLISLLKSTSGSEMFTILHCQRFLRTSCHKTLITCEFVSVAVNCSEANGYCCDTGYAILELWHPVLKSFCCCNSSVFHVSKSKQKNMGLKWKWHVRYAFSLIISKLGNGENRFIPNS
jgi:hypothetical protein